MPRNGSVAPETVTSRHALILAGIVLLGAALRLHGLAEYSLWYDEGAVLAHAGFVNCSLDFMSGDITTDAPMAPVLLCGWQYLLRLVPNLQPGSFAYDWLLRLVPCLFSIATILLAYWLALLVTGEVWVALLATFITAFSPFQVYYAQEVKPYSEYLFFSLLTFICVIKALEGNQKRYWWALPFAMSGSFYAHFFAVWNITLLGVYFLVFIRRHRNHFLKWTAVNFAFLILCLPGILLASQVSHFLERVQIMWNIHPNLRITLITFQTFFSGYTGRIDTYRALALLAGICFLIGLWKLRRQRRMLVFVLLLTVAPVLGNIVFWRLRNFPVYEHRIFISSSVLVYIVVALAIRNMRPAMLRLAMLGAIVSLMTPCLADYYAQRVHPLKTHLMGVRYKVDNRDAAAFIRSRLLPGDVILHTSHFTNIPFLYYMRGVSAPQTHVCMTPAEIAGFLQSYPNQALWNAYGVIPVPLAEATKSAKRFWLVESWWEPFEIPAWVLEERAWMDRHFIRTGETKFDGLTVYSYERKDKPAP